MRISRAAAIFPSRSGCYGCSPVSWTMRRRRVRAVPEKCAALPYAGARRLRRNRDRIKSAENANSNQLKGGVEGTPARDGQHGPDHHAIADRQSAALVQRLVFDHALGAGRPRCRESDDFAFSRALSHVTSASVLTT